MVRPGGENRLTSEEPIMAKLHFGKWTLSALALAAAGAAPVPVAPQGRPVVPEGAPLASKPTPSQPLGGPDRYLSYVSTDKPIYRANEKVYVRAVLLNAATHQPLKDDQQAQAQVQILGPRGEVVSSGSAQSENSIVAFGWTVPEGAAGGEYTFKLTYPYQGYTPAERKFDVRIYRAPRLRNQITFAREGYGPGDNVTATVHSERAEGGFPANARVTVTARVDDRQVYTGPATIDAKGDCTATFPLPKAMERGEGTLAFAIEDGGVVETAAKTIPILLQTLDLAIYPEGGDAVAGVENRFYIEAKTPAQKPADLVGAILDSKGKQVAAVKTEHEGRGRFDFTPAAGETYTLKLSEPAGIAKTWNLPAAKAHGVSLQSVGNIVLKDKPVQLKLAATDAGAYKVTLRKRELDVAEPVTAVIRGGMNALASNVQFDLKPEIDGVLTATVWNEKGEPLAERLIYRQPSRIINVQVRPDQSTYTPGGTAKFDIYTTDENGKAISSLVGLTVTDDTVQELIEKRDQAPRLPVMVMLESEVRELADAHIYLDASNPKAPIATDLLLGTQGWRRFATVNASEFFAKNGDAGRRALAFKEAPVVALGARGGGGGFGGGMPLRAMAMAGAAAMPEAAEMNAAAGVDMAARDGAAMNGGGVDKAMQKAGAGELRLEEEVRKIAPPAAPVPPPAGGRGPAAAARPMVPPQAGQRQQGFAMDADVAADEVQGFAAGGLARRAAGPGALLIVREYAHALRPNWSPSDRSDFTETVYWNAGIKTDDSGRGSATFALNDSVTSFRIFADAFSRNGAVGSSSSTVNAVQPFFIEPKIPLEVSAGDVIELPIAAVNNTPGALNDFSLTVSGSGSLKIEAPKVDATLAASGRTRNIFKITVGSETGSMDLSIHASAGAFSDKVTRQLRVRPKGFPTQLAYGGLVDAGNSAKKQIMVPNSVVPHSMTTFAMVYPSPMANLTDAVAALLQEPNGCFEQTSSTNYPLAMAQMYFMTHQGVDPKLAAKGSELLGRGYQKLIAFECKDKGYEWFGGNAAGHEALTAYGLMEFNDMKKAGLPVDDKMLDRTTTWLISRQDGKGGFQRNARALDSFGGAPELTTNSYIVWALMQAGQKLDREANAVRDAAKGSTDSYVLALAANICAMNKDTENAKFFMNQLVKKQNKEGAVEGATTSITRSGGQALAIETTALSALAWMQDKDFAGQVQNSLKFLADSCKGGRFGSTQSTILALKAIVAYDQMNAHPKAPGQLALYIDNKVVGEPIAFTADSKGAITFGDFAPVLSPGPHTVDIRMTDGSEMPFTLGVKFNSVTPATDKQCKLDLQTSLKDGRLAEGGITEARVIVSNTTDKDAASPVAIIGIPGGLEVRHDHLKELVKAGKIDAYEVNGREVVLYWRQIKANAKSDISLSLAAAVPGTYAAPASRVYEYYTDEFKQWVDGTSVTITAK
jgi:hypothetical protein